MLKKYLTLYSSRLSFAEQNNQTSKSATIEMYAPSSYNDTVTGETLSSVSEKSETYSNEGSNNDYVVSLYVLFKPEKNRLVSVISAI